MFPFKTEENDEFLTVRTVASFAEKIGPKKDREDFLQLCAFFYSSSLRKKITHTKSNRAQKKRDARQSFQKSVLAHYTRKAFTLSVDLRTRTHKPKYARFGTKHTHTHTHTLYYFGNWNGPQPRKDYEFSREEFYHA